MRDKDQVFIFNQAELDLIKHTFADNDTLLYSVRKVLLQFPLTEAESGLLKISITAPVYDVLRKRILPDVSDDFPLTQIPDIRTTLTNDLKVKSVEEMELLFEAKALEIAYLEQQFAELQGLPLETDRIVLSDMAKITKDARQNYVNMTAYLFLLGYVDPFLYLIKNIAGAKDETKDEQVARMKRDSSK